MNGHLKTKYSFLNNCIRNNVLDQAYRVYRIVAAINNKFGCRIVSDVGSTAEVIETFRNNLHRRNNLQPMVVDLNLVAHRSFFSPLDSFDSLPSLSLGELRRIAAGSYQVSEAVNYYFDTVERFGQILYWYCRRELNFDQFNIAAQDPLLIKAKVGSRYSRRASYFVFILIDRACVAGNLSENIFANVWSDRGHFVAAAM